MLEQALAYADAAGFAVLPVGADCRPGQLAWEGTSSGFIAVHDATSDPALIRAYWARHPAANVSVACGVASGIFVLDIDVKDDFDGLRDLKQLEQRHGRLPTTWRTRTPSGGAHLWFEQPGRELANRVHIRVPDGAGGEVKTGLDIRATGGCVPIPPSAKPSGPYAWIRSPWEGDYAAEAPAWLLDTLDPPSPPARPSRPLSISSSDRTVRYVQAALEHECGELARLGRGERNQRLFQASASLGELVGAGLLPEDLASEELERAAVENGLWRDDGPYQVRATIRSGLRAGGQTPREVRL